MIIVQTPLRISFLGGGTDFEDFYIHHGGAVISTAIDKYVFVIVKERFDDMICVNYSRRERVKRVSQLRHELTLADIPAEGTGLGSSSSITVGLLQALYTYRGEIVPAKTLAEEACRIEVEILGKPIGRQDQYIASFGNMRFITFNNNGVKVERVELPPEDKKRLNDNLLLFFTGVTRQSSEILSEQKANINSRVDELCEMRKLASEARDVILKGEFNAFGEILHKGWELKKQMASNVSNSTMTIFMKRHAKPVQSVVRSPGLGEVDSYSSIVLRVNRMMLSERLGDSESCLSISSRMGAR